jgi:DNA-binding transcriptional MerR regulator
MEAGYGRNVAQKLLTTGELAKALGVSGGAILVWEGQGLIRPFFKTPGGHRRWILEDVRRQLNQPLPEDDD